MFADDVLFLTSVLETGVAIDVITVANTLSKFYNKEIPIQISGNYRLGDIRHNFADISKIKSELGIIFQKKEDYINSNLTEQDPSLY